MTLKFAFDEPKAVEALAFVAQEHPGFTPFYVSKVFFYAEKTHMNKFGRPIVGDTYIAMPMGPVPSTIKNYIDENWDWAARPETIEGAITIDRKGKYARLMPGTRKPKTETLSETDVECLKAAIAFCKDKDPETLSLLTHFEKAYLSADANRAMDYADFIDDDNPHRAKILAEAEESAAYTVL